MERGTMNAYNAILACTKTRIVTNRTFVNNVSLANIRLTIILGVVMGANRANFRRQQVKRTAPSVPKAIMRHRPQPVTAINVRKDFLKTGKEQVCVVVVQWVDSATVSANQIVIPVQRQMQRGQRNVRGARAGNILIQLFRFALSATQDDLPWRTTCTPNARSARRGSPAEVVYRTDVMHVRQGNGVTWMPVPVPIVAKESTVNRWVARRLPLAWSVAQDYGPKK